MIRVHWRSYTWDPKLPSYRYRCLIPALGLQDKGLVANTFSKSKQDACLEEGNDVLILIKTISLPDLDLARRAKVMGQKVVLDICDNIFFWVDFYANSEETNFFHYYQNQSALLRELGKVVDAIVVPTESLAEKMRREFPDSRVVVIPDSLETDMLRRRVGGPFSARLAFSSYFGSPYRGLKTGIDGAYFFASKVFDRAGKMASVFLGRVTGRIAKGIAGFRRRYERVLARQWLGSRAEKYFEALSLESAVLPKGIVTRHVDDKARRPLIWFGNSGVGGIFGISELKLVEEALERVNARVPISLTVVSESDRALAMRFKAASFPIHFVPWTLEGCSREIAKSEVVVIPNSGNDFARHKSANRAVLALSIGTPVVASKISSLEPFSDCIVFDDFEAGILGYLESQELARKHVARARAVIDETFTTEKIVEKWEALFAELMPSRAASPVSARFPGLPEYQPQ